MSKVPERVLQKIEQAERTGSRVLDLSNEELTEVPEHLSRMTNLTTLGLSNNQLTEVPEHLSHMTNLTTLALSGNQLTEVPEHLFSRLTNLSWLALNGNQLTEVPEHLSRMTDLEYLYLNNNRIVTLPPSLAALPNLKALHLNGNPMEFPPKEIADQGLQSIRAFFADEAGAGSPLHEARLLIVGEPGAGNTTLANKLTIPNYAVGGEETTKGIVVQESRFPMPHKGDAPFRANPPKVGMIIWRFASNTNWAPAVLVFWAASCTTWA